MRGRIESSTGTVVLYPIAAQFSRLKGSGLRGSKFEVSGVSVQVSGIWPLASRCWWLVSNSRCGLPCGYQL